MTILYDSKTTPRFDNRISPDDNLHQYFNIEITASPDTWTIRSKSDVFTDIALTNTNTIFVSFSGGSDTGTGTSSDPVKTLNYAATIITPTKNNIALVETNPVNVDTTDATFNLSGFTKVRIIGFGGAGYNHVSAIFGATIKILNGAGVDLELYNFYINDITPFESLDGQAVNIKTYYMMVLNNQDIGNPITRNNIPTEFDMSTRINAPDYRIRFYIFNSMFINGWATNNGAYTFSIYGMENSILKNMNVDSDEHILDRSLVIYNISSYNILHGCNRVSYLANLSGYIFYDQGHLEGTAATITYSCSNNLEISGTGNILNDPLFVNNLLQLTEDYKIKTLPVYNVNSPCYQTGNAAGTENIGGYSGLIDLSISHRKYIFNINPKMYKPEKIHSKYNNENVKGTVYPYSEGIKNEILLQYFDDSYVDKYDAGFLERVSKNIYNINDPFGKIYSDIIIKIFEKPMNESLLSGNIASYDFNEKYITVNDDFVQDQFLGYNLWLKFYQTSGITFSTFYNSLRGFSTLTKNEYDNYYIFYNNNIYYIVSNTENWVYLDVYYGNISQDTGTTYIFLPFKIIDMIDGYIYFEDELNKFNKTPIGYSIKNINAIPQTAAMRYNKIGFNPYKELIKSNRTFNFLEV